MKRSTYAILAVLAALGVVWAVQNRQVAPDSPAPLTLDGLVTAPDAETARNLLRESPPKTMTLSLRRPGDEAIVLEAAPLAEGVTPEKLAERDFTASRTIGGATTKAKATAWKAAAMVEVFAAPLRSTFAQALSAKDAADFGLDAAQAIEVEAKLDGKTFRLRIGAAMKAEGSSETSTWLQAADRPDVVYQVAGQNLREPFAVAWSDLRERQILAIEPGKVHKIALDNPAGERVVVERPPLAAGQSRDGNDAWQLREPAGLTAGNVGEWVNALKNLSANQFVDAKDARDTGLDGADAARLTVDDGTLTELTVGGPVAGVSGEQVWLRIKQGDQIGYAHIAKFSRDQIVRRAAQVRDRRLGGNLQESAIQRLVLRGPKGSFAATRQPDGWQSPSDGGLTFRPEAIASYVTDALQVQVDYNPSATPTGLDQPEWSLELATATESVQVALSKETGGSVFGQVTTGGKRGEPFALASWNADKLRKEPSHFADRRLVAVAESDVVRLVLKRASGEGFVLARAADGWQLSEGDASPTPADKAKVDAWLSALLKMEWKSRAAGSDKALGLADATLLTVQLANGSRRELRFAPKKDGADSAVATDSSRWLLAAADAGWVEKTAAELR